uniref:Mitoferrin-1 n=1 Tax=Myxobolus squamalis TaxID=59785 RepID=A0A6B2G1I9_MYXSQ
MTSTLAHDSIMTPIEAIKQRLQVCSHRYVGLGQCFKKIVKIEGFGALYRSFPAQLLTNLPYHSINFIVYERTRKKLIGNEKYNLFVHLASGSVSGGIAAAITTPLDVIKTILNVQDPKFLNIALLLDSNPQARIMKADQYVIKGMLNAARTIFHARGILGFYTGLFPRVMFCVPGCAISWSVYETFKYFLSD